MVREKLTRARSKSPRRGKAVVAPKANESTLPYLSDAIVEWYGESYRQPKFGSTSDFTVKWDDFQEKAEAYLLKHNPSSYEIGKWDREDLICFFILLETRGECNVCEVQLLLNYVAQSYDNELFGLDQKIAQLIKDYDLELPWLGRWLMFHTNHKLPFVTFDPNRQIWLPRYESVLKDSGQYLANYFKYSFAKIPPLDIEQLKRPVSYPLPPFWSEGTAHLIYEFNARIAEHLPAFARQGFQAPILCGESCFDVFDREQPGWRQNVENFDIQNGKITPKPQ